MRRPAFQGVALWWMLVAVAPAAGAQDRALALPPPPLAPLLRPVSPPLEKPPVPVPTVQYPAPPDVLPELPAPRLVADLLAHPVAPLPPPRLLACNPLGSVFGVPSELLECGRARFQGGEYEEARSVLQSAVRKSTDREVVREARYWLAETLIRLGRADSVEQHLLLVVQDDPQGELGSYASHTLGWVLLQRGEAGQALARFESLIKSGAPPDLVPWARHGRALALYALKRYADARAEWLGLLGGSTPRGLATEATFWLGETLGRLGDSAGAAARLEAFVSSGTHPLTETALLRLGWWRRAAGQPLEAVKTYRGLLSAYPRTAEGLWVRAGLAQALLDVGDFSAAREEARQLDGRDRSGTLVLPTMLALSRWLAGKDRAAEAQALDQELLARTLSPPTRAYVLLLSADAYRQSGQAAEARSQLELVRSAPGRAEYGAYAALRLAELDLEGREFAQARAAAEALLGDPAGGDLRPAALIVAGEAAYWARDYEGAAALFERFLSDFPNLAQARPVMLALGWTELRRGRRDAARQLWTRFTAEPSADPRVPAALLLAAELAAEAGDESDARTLLDQLVGRFPADELTPIAVLNRAILSIRAGRSGAGLSQLAGLSAPAALSPYLGRLRLARGVALLETGRVSDAQAEFRAALAEGEDLARLGLGRVALERRQWDEATREFVAARDAGSGLVAATAEYGLAACLFNEGKKEDFSRLAAPLLSGPSSPATTPYLLAAMAQVAGEQKKWPEARSLTMRLASEFPAMAPPALASLAAAASREGQWALARDAYQALIDRDPTSPAVSAGQVDFAEALLRSGAAAQARQRLESFVAAAPGDARLPRALLLLGQAREATGDRAGALEVYARLRQEYPTAPGAETTLLAQGRLLQTEGKWTEARPLLERGLENPDPGAAAEAAYWLGEGFRAAGQMQDAAEFYMTAAYLAPDSPWGRRALLGAGQSFIALKQKDSAEIVYRKLAEGRDVEPELAESARKELRALGVN